MAEYSSFVRNGNHTLFISNYRQATTAVYNTPQMPSKNQVPFSDRSSYDQLHRFDRGPVVLLYGSHIPAMQLPLELAESMKLQMTPLMLVLGMTVAIPTLATLLMVLETILT
ncbi:hypothetical protein DM01DRAFT_316968 [Hesseltinella vesiculosa]|uniref:Uncharacterized protein n=1 Tax=Hesseltinella vesiculosa TaxID=101127 RepID=A0A1X2GJQ5_9FUNG|nr:hypothetical protein DM01DRAFT_316968 [Hesseltinella vesiculosa]